MRSFVLYFFLDGLTYDISSMKTVGFPFFLPICSTPFVGPVPLHQRRRGFFPLGSSFPCPGNCPGSPSFASLGWRSTLIFGRSRPCVRTTFLPLLLFFLTRLWRKCNFSLVCPPFRLFLCPRFLMLLSFVERRP